VIGALLLVVAAPPQAEIAPPRLAPPVEVAIASARLQCDLHNDDGNAVRFALQRGGGTAQSYGGALMGIPLTAAVIDDPDNVLAGYALDAWGQESIFGRAGSPEARRAFGERFQILLDRTGRSADLNQPSRVAIRIHEHRPPKWGVDPYVRAVGFCDVIPDSSLTRADAKEPDQ
jgi:hypothetical protein